MDSVKSMMKDLVFEDGVVDMIMDYKEQMEKFESRYTKFIDKLFIKYKKDEYIDFLAAVDKSYHIVNVNVKDNQLVIIVGDRIKSRRIRRAYQKIKKNVGDSLLYDKWIIQRCDWNMGMWYMGNSICVVVSIVGEYNNTFENFNIIKKGIKPPRYEVTQTDYIDAVKTFASLVRNFGYKYNVVKTKRNFIMKIGSKCDGVELSLSFDGERVIIKLCRDNNIVDIDTYRIVYRH